MLPTYIGGDFEMVKVIDFDVLNERMEFRVCLGCGVEHLLRREHQLLNPNPDDPRPLCSGCQRAAELRERAAAGTGRGTPLTDIREIADLVLALKAVLRCRKGESIDG